MKLSVAVFFTALSAFSEKGLCSSPADVGAARAGAKVALVERYGSLGGLFTNGMVLWMMCTGRVEDGRWSLVTRGVCEEFMKRACTPHLCWGVDIGTEK